MATTFDFAAKGALIIGAGQNIGRAIALEWARRGARVAVADIRADGAEETAALIRDTGGEATGIGIDVSDEASVAAGVAAAAAFLGAIDVHMNNAGLIHSGNPQDFPVAEWQRMFDVNFFCAVRANAVVLPMMIARGSGYIVNTSSFAGLYPYATNRIPYAASKAALVSMSENMALHLERHGIRVSCLCPGPTYTTSTVGMKPWGEDVMMRGPGSDLSVKSQEEVAAILSDAMEAGRILIPTHDRGYDYMRDHAADPDGFVRAKAADFAEGRSGLPGR
jgi:NAD(P)-dependent dehydrogenase (short-subunit alcohol dehydrogenase family)